MEWGKAHCIVKEGRRAGDAASPCSRKRSRNEACVRPYHLAQAVWIWGADDGYDGGHVGAVSMRNRLAVLFVISYKSSINTVMRAELMRD
jgi:hypothetical protein